jgi:hypothetical protein
VIGALVIAAFLAAVALPTAALCNIGASQRSDAKSRAAFAGAAVWFFLGVFVMAWIIGG